MNRALILVLAVFSVAATARQKFSCQGIGQDSDYVVHVDFNPAVELKDNWQKNAIIPYDFGKKDDGGTTTAAVFSRFPYKTPYGGRKQWSGFYDVNQQEPAGGGYSSYFGGKAYRIIHGFDADSDWDMMFYYPESVVGVDAKSFTGLVTAQMNIMDQGYYHIKMECSSKVY